MSGDGSRPDGMSFPSSFIGDEPLSGDGSRPALLLVAHGERQVSEPNRALAEHASALAGRVACAPVLCGVLSGQPALETALDAMPPGKARKALIFPFFMANGYFVKTVLPDRVAACRPKLSVTYMAPLGLQPGLSKMLMKMALATAESAGFQASRCRLIIAGHGSRKGPASARATKVVTGQLEAMQSFMSVAASFVEEPPFIADELAREATPAVVCGFFASNGMHSTRDVPMAIEESGARAVYAGPIGIRPEVRELVAAECERTLSVTD